MNKWELILSVTFLIILGAVVGSVATESYFKRWFLIMGVSPNARAEYIMKRISKDLNLSQDQEKRISEIVERSEQELQKIKQLERKRVVDRIKMELNSDQQKELESLKGKAEKRRQQIKESYPRQWSSPLG